MKNKGKNNWSRTIPEQTDNKRTGKEKKHIKSKGSIYHTPITILFVLQMTTKQNNHNQTTKQKQPLLFRYHLALAITTPHFVAASLALQEIVIQRLLHFACWFQSS